MSWFWVLHALLCALHCSVHEGVLRLKKYDLFAECYFILSHLKARPEALMPYAWEEL